MIGVLALVFLSGLGWLVARPRLAPRGPVSATEELAGATAALLALAVVALLVVATNPFALIFLLPSLHAWLWLPHVRPRPIWTRLAVLAPASSGRFCSWPRSHCATGSGSTRPGISPSWPRPATSDCPRSAIAVGWLAAAGQMTALTIGRYAPYPSARERPPRGPLREAVRRMVLTVRAARRQPPGSERKALEG